MDRITGAGDDRPRDADAAPVRPASIKDIARRAGVSPTTVSHALSGRRPVAPETAARIRALVPELGYVPYLAARTLRPSRSLMIGLVVPDISNRFFGEIAAGVEQYANDQDYGMALCTSQADPRREKRYFNMLRGGALDGIIYNAADASWDGTLPAIATQFPVVVVDEQVPGIASAPLVTADHRLGGELAGRHLRALGHESTVVLSGPQGLASSAERSSGFREIFPAAIHRSGDYTEASGRALALEVLRAHPGVTAIFAGNDAMAFGAIAAARELGSRVPHDVSVLGFDDVDFAARSAPALTTVRQPAVELGRRSAQLLLDQILHGRRSETGVLSLPVELVVRESTAAPRTSRR